MTLSKMFWSMMRVVTFWNIWVKEVALVYSPFPLTSALFSTLQCISLFKESYSEWFIYSFSTAERSSQAGLMPILFLQSKTYPDVPFRRVKRNKVKKKRERGKKNPQQTCTMGAGSSSSSPKMKWMTQSAHTHVSTLKVHTALGKVCS